MSSHLITLSCLELYSSVPDFIGSREEETTWATLNFVKHLPGVLSHWGLQEDGKKDHTNVESSNNIGVRTMSVAPNSEMLAQVSVIVVTHTLTDSAASNDLSPLVSHTTSGNGTAVSALIRSILLENPFIGVPSLSHLKVTLLHCDVELPATDRSAVRTAINHLAKLTCSKEQSGTWTSLSREQVFHLCGKSGAISVPRLVPVPQLCIGPFEVYLKNNRRGALSGLSMRPILAPWTEGFPDPLPNDSICVRVRSVGLNFRDVLNVMGLYPGDPGPLGADFSGTIVRVGPEVPSHQFHLGQRVFGIAPGCLKTFALTRAALVAPIPEGFSYSDAAALPVAATTVEHCLMDIGKVKRGDRVLIHAATGGVGLAAVQLCLRDSVKAEVFATVGSFAKSEYLQREYGVQFVSSSRDPEAFKRDMQQALGEDGRLDVVLNCLGGDFIAYSVDFLREGGYFIEIGKRQIWDKEKMAAYRPDIHYSIVAVDSLIAEDPWWFSGQLRRLCTLAEAKILKKLPLSVFQVPPGDNATEIHTKEERKSSGDCVAGEPVSNTKVDISEAFRYLQRAQHIGKVVLRFTSPFDLGQKDTAQRNAVPLPSALGEVQGSVLITGASGGVGTAVVSWLLLEGADHLILCSRRGASKIAAEVQAAETTFIVAPVASKDVLYDGRVVLLESGQRRVLAVSCDVGKAEDVDWLFDSILMDDNRFRFPRLVGILHTAGIVKDGLFNRLTEDTFKTVFHPKTIAAKLLHEACERRHLNEHIGFFVCFSSVSGVVGNAGQTNYAAANAALDVVMQERRNRGYAGLSLQWGPWQSRGMTERFSDQQLREAGFEGMPTDVGLRALHDWLTTTAQASTAALCCALFRWDSFFERYNSGCIPPYFDRIIEERKGRNLLEGNPNAAGLGVAVSGGKSEAYDWDILNAYKELDDAAIEAAVINKVQTAAEKIIGGKGQSLPLDVPLVESGIDSLAAVEFGNELSASLGIKLSTTMLFSYPTLRLLQGFLTKKVIAAVHSIAGLEKDVNDQMELKILSPPTAATPGGFFYGSGSNISTAACRLSGQSIAHSNAVAIVGVACNFPAQSSDIGRFWDSLLAGEDAVSLIPEERFDIMDVYDADPMRLQKCYVREAAFVQNADRFDRCFFNISATETVSMDPQQRWMLTIAYDALIDAGWSKAAVVGRHIGVYIGCCNFDWHILDQTLIPENSYSSTGSAMSLVSNRVSYSLGLRGPSTTVDTACSSSLIAADAAVEKLSQDPLVDAFVVGGVNLMLAPHPFVLFCRTRMLSPSCRCKTFDAAADGYVRGEGAGAAVLMRLSDALQAVTATEASDASTSTAALPIRRILAVIRGSGVNHDGQSASLTAPNGQSQEEVMRKALTKSGVHPTQVSVIECHGTGTALGDPIEVAAIKAVYCEGLALRRLSKPSSPTSTKLGEVSPRSTCPLHLAALKTNIGHLEGAAGIAGLIKLCLVLRHNCVPRNLHFTKLNSHIDFEDYALIIPTEPSTHLVQSGDPACEKDVTALETRWGSVSAFGFGGANVHVVLESWKPKYQCPTVHHDTLTNATLEDSVQALPASCLPSTADPSNIPPRLVFLFSGQGSQYAASAAELYRDEPVFQSVFSECSKFLEPYIDGVSLAEFFYGTDASVASDESQRQLAHVLLFCIEYALFRLLVARGIVPDIVVGHSVGEYVAAVAAGVLKWKDALKMVAYRGRLIHDVTAASASCGVMVACRLSEKTVTETIERYQKPKGKAAPEEEEFNKENFVTSYPRNSLPNVALAAINGPNSVVLSGPETEVAFLLKALDVGNTCKYLAVSQAFHSPVLRPAIDPFLRFISENKIVFALVSEGVSYVSCRTGKKETSLCGTADYWAQHIVDPVRYYDAVKTVVELGGTIFVEVGCGGALISLGRQCIPLSQQKEQKMQWFQCLPRNSESPCAFSSVVTSIRAYSAANRPDKLFENLKPNRPMDYLTHTWHAEQYPWQRTYADLEAQLGGSAVPPGTASHGRYKKTRSELTSSTLSPHCHVLRRPILSRESLSRNSGGISSIGNTSSTASIPGTEAIWDTITQVFMEICSRDTGHNDFVKSLSPDSLIADVLQNVDSLSALEFKELLEERLQLIVPATALLDHKTLGELHRYLCSEAALSGLLAGPLEKATNLEGVLPSVPYTGLRFDALHQAQCKVMVSGIGLRLPGGVQSLHEFWNFCANRQSGFVKIPHDRLPLDAYYRPYEAFINSGAAPHLGKRDASTIVESPALPPMTTYSRHAALLKDPTLFRPALFGLSVAEAFAMDPQQRLLLDVVADAINNERRRAFEKGLLEKPICSTGNMPKLNLWCPHTGTLESDKVGVYVGFSDAQEWPILEASHQGFAMKQTTKSFSTVEMRMLGSAPCIMANRVSHIFNLCGPSLTIDSGCSSSGVALATAVAALASGECNAAIVGGVSLLLTPMTLCGFSASRYLAPGGEVYAFDKRACGTLRGEAAVSVILRREPTSEEASLGQMAHAWIRSAVVNNSGRSPHITAFCGTAQTQLHQKALISGTCDPCDIRYIEAHGTGIALSDSVEIHALKSTFASAYCRSDNKNNASLILGSLHPNMGHLNGAQPVAQLIKAILSLEKQIALPILNFNAPHPLLNLTGFTCTFPTEDNYPLVVKKNHETSEVNGPAASDISNGLVSCSSSPLGLVQAFGMGGTNCAVIVEPASCGSEVEPLSNSLMGETEVPSLPFPWKSFPSYISMLAPVGQLFLKAAEVTPVDDLKALCEALRKKSADALNWIPAETVNQNTVLASPTTHHVLLLCGRSDQLSDVLLWILYRFLSQSCVAQCTVVFLEALDSSGYTIQQNLEMRLQHLEENQSLFEDDDILATQHRTKTQNFIQSKLRVFCGEADRPRWGLSERQFQNLVDVTDTLLVSIQQPKEFDFPLFGAQTFAGSYGMVRGTYTTVLREACCFFLTSINARKLQPNYQRKPLYWGAITQLATFPWLDPIPQSKTPNAEEWDISYKTHISNYPLDVCGIAWVQWVIEGLSAYIISLLDTEESALDTTHCNHDPELQNIIKPKEHSAKPLTVLRLHRFSPSLADLTSEGPFIRHLFQVLQTWRCLPEGIFYDWIDSSRISDSWITHWLNNIDSPTSEGTLQALAKQATFSVMSWGSRAALASTDLATWLTLHMGLSCAIVSCDTFIARFEQETQNVGIMGPFTAYITWKLKCSRQIWERFFNEFDELHWKQRWELQVSQRDPVLSSMDIFLRHCQTGESGPRSPSISRTLAPQFSLQLPDTQSFCEAFQRTGWEELDVLEEKAVQDLASKAREPVELMLNALQNSLPSSYTAGLSFEGWAFAQASLQQVYLTQFLAHLWATPPLHSESPKIKTLPVVIIVGLDRVANAVAQLLLSEVPGFTSLSFSEMLFPFGIVSDETKPWDVQGRNVYAQRVLDGLRQGARAHGFGNFFPENATSCWEDTLLLELCGSCPSLALKLNARGFLSWLSEAGFKRVRESSARFHSQLLAGILKQRSNQEANKNVSLTDNNCTEAPVNHDCQSPCVVFNSIYHILSLKELSMQYPNAKWIFVEADVPERALESHYALSQGFQRRFVLNPPMPLSEDDALSDFFALLERHVDTTAQESNCVPSRRWTCIPASFLLENPIAALQQLTPQLELNSSQEADIANAAVRVAVRHRDRVTYLLRSFAPNRNYALPHCSSAALALEQIKKINSRLLAMTHQANILEAARPPSILFPDSAIPSGLAASKRLAQPTNLHITNLIREMLRSLKHVDAKRRSACLRQIIETVTPLLPKAPRIYEPLQDLEMLVGNITQLYHNVEPQKCPDPPCAVQSIRTVFLTGATGFVGRHVLHSLIQLLHQTPVVSSTGADTTPTGSGDSPTALNCVLCLVRCTTPTDGIERLRRAFLEASLPWDDRTDALVSQRRLWVVPGFVDAEYFGLPAPPAFNIDEGGALDAAPVRDLGATRHKSIKKTGSSLRKKEHHKQAKGVTSTMCKELEHPITYAVLCRIVDLVIHTAADISHFKSYSSVRDVNVQGVYHVYRFCMTRKIKHLHYTSSLACFPEYYFGLFPTPDAATNDRNDHNILPVSPSVHSSRPYEFELPTHEVLLNYFLPPEIQGYPWSKWISERFLTTVSHPFSGQGVVPVTIYRLPHVFASAETGFINPREPLFLITKLFIILGQFPTTSSETSYHYPGYSLTSVNQVAQVLLQSAFTPTRKHPLYQLCNPTSIDLASATNTFLGLVPSMSLIRRDPRCLKDLLDEFACLCITCDEETNSGSPESSNTDDFNLIFFYLWWLYRETFIQSRPPLEIKLDSAYRDGSRKWMCSQRLQEDFPDLRWPSPAKTIEAMVYYCLKNKVLPATARALRTVNPQDVVDAAQNLALWTQEHTNQWKALTKAPDAVDIAEATFRQWLREDILTSLSFGAQAVILHSFLHNLTTHYWMRHIELQFPQICRRPIVQPVFIVGLNRTGTSFMHKCLSLSQHVRCPRLYELLVPYGDMERDHAKDLSLLNTSTDYPYAINHPTFETFQASRINAAEELLKVQNNLLPQTWTQLHPQAVDDPEEDFYIFQKFGRCVSLQLLLNHPAYTEWLSGPQNDYTTLSATYRLHRRFLQHLDAQRGACDGQRWILKMPFHLFTLDGLFSEYPDAHIIFMHRNPCDSLRSWSSLVHAVSDFASASPPSLDAVGQSQLRLTTTMMQRAQNFRLQHPELETRFIDVEYNTFVTDPVATVKRIYESLQFNLAWTAEYVETLEAFVARQPRLHSTPNQAHHHKVTHASSDARKTRTPRGTEEKTQNINIGVSDTEIETAFASYLMWKKNLRML